MSAILGNYYTSVPHFRISKAIVNPIAPKNR